jgi:hypothetical protein
MAEDEIKIPLSGGLYLFSLRKTWRLVAGHSVASLVVAGILWGCSFYFTQKLRSEDAMKDFLSSAGVTAISLASAFLLIWVANIVHFTPKAIQKEASKLKSLLHPNQPRNFTANGNVTHNGDEVPYNQRGYHVNLMIPTVNRTVKDVRLEVYALWADLTPIGSLYGFQPVTTRRETFAHAGNSAVVNFHLETIDQNDPLYFVLSLSFLESDSVTQRREVLHLKWTRPPGGKYGPVAETPFLEINRIEKTMQI